MIKKGQIYQMCFTKKTRYVITQASLDNEVSVIYQNGFANNYIDFDNKKDILIKEYPTWQEAVNSPEFNGGVK